MVEAPVRNRWIARAARRRGCRGQDQPRTGRVIHPTHAEAYGQALNADAEGVGAYKPLSSSLMPIPKRPCGSKVKSQPTGEIIDTKPVLNGVTEPTKPCIAWANPILVLCGASLAW